MATTTIYYNTAGANNWTAYWGVDLINVEMWGAGGAGANRTSNGQGGGGKGGAYSRNNNFAPTAGVIYSLNVGRGGNTNNNSNGTNSTFNNGTVLAEGGATAGRNNATGQTAGGSAANSVGETKYSGGNGVTGNATIFGGGGGSSAGNASNGRDGQGNVGGGNGTDSANLPAGAGAGGNGAKTGSAVGTAGVAPGGAGGGATRNSTTNRAGGNGANGRIVISYTTPLTEKLADDFTGVTAADASQGSTGTNFGFGQFAAVRYRGQRFTPTHSGDLTKIGFNRTKGSQGIKVYIDTITSNAPTHAVGSELYSFTITNANVIDQYGEYTLPTPLAVTGGTEYCFYLAPWDTTGNAYADDYQDLHGIASGAEITNNAGSWSTENLAFNFAVYITNTLDTRKWSNWGGANCYILNGELKIVTDATTNYYGMESLGVYDLTGSYAIMKVVNAGSQVTDFTCAAIDLTLDASNSIGFIINSGLLVAQKHISGTYSEVASTTYNSTNHKYLKIRESGGTVYWDYSADGLSWTNLGSIAVASLFAVTALIQGCSAGCDSAGLSASYVLLDDFNIVLKSPTDSGSGSDAVSKSEVGSTTPVDITDSGSGSDAGSILGLLGLTDSGTGSDAPSILGLIPVGDSGAGSDTLALLALLSIIDSYWGDNFDDGTLDTTIRWLAWGGVPPTESGGNLNIPSQLSPAYCGVDARTPRDFTGHKFWCDLADAGNQSIASWGVYFQLSQDASNAIYLSVEAGSLVARQKVAGVQTTLASTTYNAVSHKYLQLRESSGTIYFEYSADRVNWSTLATLTTPYPITITSVYLEVIGGTWQAEASTTTALVNEVGTDYVVNVGSDAITLMTILGITDTMSGSDVLSILGLIPVTDTSSASELLSILALVAVTDSGSGVDNASAGNSIVVDDSGSATDALSLLALIGLSDTAQGSEALNILATIGLSDSGSGSDALAILALVSMSDSGSATDALSLLAMIAMSDSGSANEALAILALISVTDTSAGVEALGILNSLLVTDSGVGADVASILALLGVDDLVIGGDTVDIFNYINVSDSGSFDEAISALKAIEITDTSVGSENILVIVRQALSMIRNVIAQRGRGTILKQKGIGTIQRQREAQSTLSQNAQSVILKQRK